MRQNIGPAPQGCVEGINIIQFREWKCLREEMLKVPRATKGCFRKG